MRTLTPEHEQLIASLPDEKSRESMRKTFTQPSGKEFRDSLPKLPDDRVDAAEQMHVMILASDASPENLECAWDTLAGACHHRDLKPIGYVDHLIEDEGETWRVIRAILPTITN